MIDISSLRLLCTPECQHSIEESIERDPTSIALDKRVEHASLIASQVKYLQRAKSKLPSYYAARCIIPSRAYEQSSSEATAAVKALTGESLLELTCGLGVDTLHLSKRFKRVVTLERDSTLAEVARVNFARLGADNIEVVTASAEEYLESCSELFDTIYVDPDRRTKSGNRAVRLEDCSPNILALKPRLMELCKQLTIKLSPLFDTDEAFKLFAPALVEVVSLGAECKEVVVTTPFSENTIKSCVVGQGEISTPMNMVDNRASTAEFNSAEWHFLTTPDVALQKSRTACHTLRPYASMWSNNGYAFSLEATPTIMGRCEEIDSIEEYNPKRLKKRLKEEGITRVEILKRDFSTPIEQIAKQLGVKIGGEKRIAFTTINGKSYSISLK